MARKPVTREDFNASYDEIIKELTTTITGLTIDNTVMKIMIKKLELIVNELDHDCSVRNEEF